MIKSETEKNTKSKIEIKKRFYNLFLPNKTYEKIEKIVSCRKFFESAKFSRSNFILEAMTEKLHRDKTDPAPLTNPAKSVHFKFDMELDEEINEQINLVRQYRRSYSKKKWIEDAILEKIEKDEATCKTQLQEYQKKLLESR